MWKRVLLGTFLLYFIAFGCASVAQQTQDQAEQDLRVEGLMKVWDCVDRYFASYSFDQTEWEKTLEEYLPLVKKTQSDSEYHSLLKRMLASLRDGQTYFWTPDTRPQFVPPIRIAEVERRMVIVEVGNEIKETELYPGMEVISVEGCPVYQALERLYPFISASTQQGLKAYAWELLLADTVKKDISLTFSDSLGNERKVSLPRSRAFFQPWVNDTSWVKADTLKGGYGYIQLTTFNNDGAVELFDQALDKLMGAPGLILDLRGNLGGESECAFKVTGRLTDKPMRSPKVSERQFDDSLQIWRTFDFNPIQPRGDSQYTGPLVILVDARTGSVAEDFLISFQDEKRAIIIGQPTGGSSGQPYLVELSSDSKAVICTRVILHPDGSPLNGVGILPDVEVYPTIAGLTAGRDEVLERGIQILQSMDR